MPEANTKIRPRKPQGPNLFDLLKPYRGLIAVLIVMTILGNALNLLVPKIISSAIDTFAQQRLILPTVIVELIAVAVGILVFAYFQAVVQTYASERVARDLRTRLVTKISGQDHVIENLDKLVVKAANESGGYGMLVGPHSTAEQREKFRGAINADPRNYIAQPTLALSRVPVIVEDHFEGRHVDLRPYVLYGKDIFVLPGGLTRVALKKGSLVVNSSQGGGSKDTWVLADSGVSC